MASYFILELDTTPPVLTIEHSVVDTQSTDLYLRVTSNEELSPDHEIYLSDYSGKMSRFMLLNQNGHSLEGVLNLTGMLLDSLVLYVSVWDDVRNHANEVVGIINNIDGHYLTVSVSQPQSMATTLQLESTAESMAIESSCNSVMLVSEVYSTQLESSVSHKKHN